MRSSLRAGAVVIAAVALGIGLTGCGSDKTAPSSSSSTGTAGSNTSQAAPPDKTIAQYIKENNITESEVHPGDPGAPTIDVPVPPGWQNASKRAPKWAYGAFVYNTPQTANDQPSIIMLVRKLSGDVDKDKILEYSAGEIQQLPGYQGPPNGTRGQVGGFDATQIGGSFTKNGTQRAVGQMTTVIPGNGALYVLQLNAESPPDQAKALSLATGFISQQAKITP